MLHDFQTAFQILVWFGCDDVPDYVRAPGLDTATRELRALVALGIYVRSGVSYSAERELQATLTAGRKLR